MNIPKFSIPGNLDCSNFQPFKEKFGEVATVSFIVNLIEIIR